MLNVRRHPARFLSLIHQPTGLSVQVSRSRLLLLPQTEGCNLGEKTAAVGMASSLQCT